MDVDTDPGPIEKTILYDQENHVSSAVWDGEKMDVDTDLGPIEKIVLYDQENHVSSAVWDGEKMDDETDPGPIEKTVLYDQENHVSSAVWDGEERGSLRCHEHTLKLDQWTLTERQIELVKKAGFGFLRLIPKITLDCSLISALVERWRPETNTFHLNVGEITITLKDVALLLGLPIDGEPVIEVKSGSSRLVCERLLGRAPGIQKGTISLKWLKDCFSKCPEDATTEELERHARAYLLYLLGSTIFSTSGNNVSAKYLSLFENFDQTGKYAWGAAALAFLYRALGNAAHKETGTISGCLTLLQCWSYYHLNIGRPQPSHHPINDRFPFVLCWKERRTDPGRKGDLVSYRKALDLLKPCDVEWLPYKNMESAIIPENIKTELMLGKSKTMLICFEIVERHLPDRCLRQFDMLQPIPENVQPWERKTCTGNVSENGNLKERMKFEVDEWLARGDNIVNSDHGVDESEYMQWYLRITRKVVGRPKSLASDFRNQIVGVKEIANIFDSLSVDGMKDQNKMLIGEIKDFLNKCLTGEFGSSQEKRRRKKGAKRKRPNDPVRCLPICMDDHSVLQISRD